MNNWFFMEMCRSIFRLAALVGALLALPLSGSANVLVVDATSKTNQVKFGETESTFTFSLTNPSSEEISVFSVRTSCGCTVAKLPTLPWRLTPGASGEIQVKMDLRGKFGLMTKTVTVESTSGVMLLVVNSQIPEPDPRQRNQMLAQSDRQAVFRHDCAQCHAEPAVGKHGADLFKVACGICHEAEHRAAMVPDLKALTKPTDGDYWAAWIARGKPGSLMPAFAKSEGGPLDNEQIQSLVEFLTKEYRVAAGLDLGDPFAKPLQ